MTTTSGLLAPMIRLTWMLKSQGIFTLLFSMTASGLRLYLASTWNLYFRHKLHWKCEHTLLWRLLYYFWASILHPLMIFVFVSTASPLNQHVSEVAVWYTFFWIDRVFKPWLACYSWAATNNTSVSCFKYPLASQFQEWTVFKLLVYLSD